MLYHLLRELLEGRHYAYENPLFRGVCAALLCFALMLLFLPRVIRQLIKWKLGDRPEFDHASLNELTRDKSNVPTMGGVMILGVIVLSILLLADLTNFYVQMALVCLVWLGALGAVDPDCASGDASILPPGRRFQILTEGGTDVPVVVDCPPEDPDCASGDASILPPGRRLRILSEGGTDVPVVSGYTALWRVFSREDCPLVVLTIPDVPRGGAIVLKFNTSDTQAAGRIRLTRGRSAELLSSAAMSILDGGCF